MCLFDALATNDWQQMEQLPSTEMCVTGSWGKYNKLNWFIKHIKYLFSITHDHNLLLWMGLATLK